MKEQIKKTLANLNADAFLVARKMKQVTGEKNNYYITLEQLDTLSTAACPCDCTLDSAYGFVPEDGCPIHDNPKEDPYYNSPM